MKTLVISQLIQAVLVIVTTILTVRYTQLGSFGINQKFKDKLKTRFTTISWVSWFAVIGVGPLLISVLLALAVRDRVVGEGPPSRIDVFYISFYMIASFFWLSQAAKNWGDLINAYIQWRAKKRQKQPPDVPQ